MNTPTDPSDRKSDMPTPSQPSLIIETPFGTAEVRDSRYYADHQDSRPTYARIYFEQGLTVNRKEYKGVGFELQRGYAEGEPYYVGPTGYNYRELTESARDKVRAWFALPENREIFAPYLEPLEADDIRQQIKSSVRHSIGSALHGTEGDRKFPQDSRELVHELIREVLTDALEYTKDGASFSNFYFERD